MAGGGDVKSNLADLTDGSEILFRFEKPTYYAVWDGETYTTFQGRRVEKLVFLSKEWTDVALDGRGKRVFTAPQWYFERLGLV